MVRSQAERDLDAALKSLYPSDIVIQDMAIKLPRTTLYVDRVLKKQMLAVECDGIQHSQFNAHFHRDADGFKKSKTNDRMKTEWLEERGYTVVRFSHSEKITAASLRRKILDSK